MSSTTPSPQEAFVHGQLINLVRTGRAVTRPGLEQETGIGRKVVTQRVQQAIDVGLLEDGDLDAIEREVGAEIARAVEFAEQGSPEPVEDLGRFVYMEEVP
jgi:TPP-dependent pyruvate/acetoin dehydrogenase alpha subunit